MNLHCRNNKTGIWDTTILVSSIEDVFEIIEKHQLENDYDGFCMTPNFCVTDGDVDIYGNSAIDLFKHNKLDGSLTDKM